MVTPGTIHGHGRTPQRREDANGAVATPSRGWHVRCYLREIREERRISLAGAAKCTGISKGDLSRLERGVLLPSLEQTAAMAAVYGYGPYEWYPPTVLRALSLVSFCAACGVSLPPSARANRVYHDRCRP